jgi:hypothetical protein
MNSMNDAVGQTLAQARKDDDRGILRVDYHKYRLVGEIIEFRVRRLHRCRDRRLVLLAPEIGKMSTDA